MDTPHEVLRMAVEWAVLLVDAMAVIVVVVGSLHSFFAGARWIFSRSYAANESLRTIWLWYVRWLVAALTFMLAADILETTLSPGREDLIRLAAIAGIRTFLNYFLEKDLQELRESVREDRMEGDAARQRP